MDRVVGGSSPLGHPRENKMAMRITFYFEDKTPRPVAIATGDMHRVMKIKGDIQKATGRKIIAHRIQFISIKEMEAEMFIVRPLDMRV